jgi:cellulose synthase/poly-beta-1,6-N-acetylglucosamine synthase-like glycosyltransferase
VTIALIIVSGILGGLFALSQLRFLVLMIVPRRPPPRPAAGFQPALVAIQIATYREATTLPSLLEAIAWLEWPREKLLVQVLDDSPAEDAVRIDAVVAEHAGRGLAVSCHRRGSREGFKAGALNHGLLISDGVDFIAYFDADCRPHRRFLHNVMPWFADPKIAAVQARWTYPNAKSSALTALQAAAFEYLFAYDYPVRAGLGLPAYYLGSAAIWRRSVPIALGGWRFVPFTAEDVDMGLRAGIAGWTIAYEPEALAHDDAVEDILAFRAQQRRWAQAVLQAGIDAAPSLPRTLRRPWPTLMEWTSFVPHMLIPLTPLLCACLALWVFLAEPVPGLFWIFSVLMTVSPATMALALAQRRLHPEDWRARVGLILRGGPYAGATMSSFLFGLADFFNRGRLEFVTTPKAGRIGVIGGLKRKWLRAQLGPLALDLAFVLLYGAAAAEAIRGGIVSALLPLLMMAIIFAASAVQTGLAFHRLVQTELAGRSGIV